MTMNERCNDLASEVLDRCRARGLKLATAESCTGGLIAAVLTDIAGSSDVFDRGFVTYADAAKVKVLGVPEALIVAHGAVSEPVARAMAEGTLSTAAADVTVAVTGIAGPGGGTAAKPVGLVHLAAARAGGATVHERREFDGDRKAVRAAAVEAALTLLLSAID